jgi:ABC-type branched-subunit amino acid transport system substrate-binding protein
MEAVHGELPFKLIIRDTRSDPGRAVVAVKELADLGVGAILGPIATAEPACKAAQEQNMPIIAVTQKAHLAEIGDYVFRNFITPEMQAEAVAAYVIEELGIERFAVLYPNEVYGITFMKHFWEAVVSRGGRITAIEKYDPKKTDFADPIKKLVGVGIRPPSDIRKAKQKISELYRPKRQPQPLILGLADIFGDHAARYMGLPTQKSDKLNRIGKTTSPDEPQPVIDFDALFIPDSPKKAGLIIPQLAYYDVKGIFLLGTNLWHSKRMIEMTRKYIQGAILPEGFFAGSRLPVVKRFVDHFTQTYAEEPGVIEATFFDSANILFQLLSDPEIRLRSQVKARLLEMDSYTGATGRTRFKDNGEILKELFLLQIKGAQFVELEWSAPLSDDSVKRQTVIRNRATGSKEERTEGGEPPAAGN